VTTGGQKWLEDHSPRLCSALLLAAIDCSDWLPPGMKWPEGGKEK